MNLFNIYGKISLYFRRGHNTYIGLPLSLINMGLIFYNFAFKNFAFIPEKFKSLPLFIFIFFLTYLPLCIIIGIIDYKKGSFKSEQETIANNSPNWQKLFKELKQIKEKLK